MTRTTTEIVKISREELADILTREIGRKVETFNIRFEDTHCGAVIVKYEREEKNYSEVRCAR